MSFALVAVSFILFSSQIGVSYQQKLRDGITVTLSSNIDGTKLNQPGHKLGLCLEMEA